MVTWLPAVCMLSTAELISWSQWSGNCYWYVILLFLNGLTVCYRTFKLKSFYSEPTKIEVYQFEERLMRQAQAENEVKNKLNEALKSNCK